MTAYTSSQSGLASASSTWGGAGHPSVNGDTFSIGSSHNVTWDLDLSGLSTGLGANTVNGGLEFSTTAGTYGMKLNGTITFGAASHFYINNGLGSAYPANCTAIMTFAAGTILITNGCVIDVRCQDTPTHLYCKLSIAASATDTVLNVDTDLTGGGDSSYWKLNAWGKATLINIDNINQTNQSETRTISAVSSSTITITAGLTNSKLLGSYILLMSRNIKFTGTTGLSCWSVPINGHIDAEHSTWGSIVSGAATLNATFGGTWYNGNSGTGAQVNRLIVNSVISQLGTQVFNANNNDDNQSVDFRGVISGCANVMAIGGAGSIIRGLITGCGTCFDNMHELTFYNALVYNSGTGIRGGSFRAYNTVFSGNATDIGSVITAGELHNSFYSGNPSPNASSGILYYMESFDDLEVAGAYRAWSQGAKTNSVSSPTFDATRLVSYDVVGRDQTQWGFFKRRVVLEPGQTVDVRCYVRKDHSITVGIPQLPRLWIYESGKEPILGDSPDVEVVMTNSTNTWEILHGAVTNSTSYSRTYWVVCAIKDQSFQNTYFDPVIRVSGMLFDTSSSGGMAA